MAQQSNKTTSAVKQNTAVFSPAWLWGVFILYGVFICYGLSYHEPWRDEAQSWLLARDLDISGLFKILPSEGHPPLWYLLIMPLAKLGLPYYSQNILAALLAMAGVFLLLFKSDLPLWARLVIPFGYFFIYEYAVFARSYCLIVFFIAAIISLYPRRFSRPWLYSLALVGLFNTHVVMFAFTAALSGLYVYELVEQKKLTNKRFLFPLIALLIGGGYLLPYLAFHHQASLFTVPGSDHTKQAISVITNGLLAADLKILAFVLLIGSFILLFIHTRIAVVFLIGAAGLLYILVYRYTGSMRHYGMLYIMLLACMAIAYSLRNDDGLKSGQLIKYIPILLVAITVLQYKQSAKAILDDINYLYSDSKNAAEFIQDNNLEDKIIIAQTAWAGSAMLPYLDKNKRLYYSECQRYGTYYIYDSCYFQNKWATGMDYALDNGYINFKDRLQDVIFVFSFPLRPEADKYVDRLYASDDDVIQKLEKYYIYRFKPQVK